MTREIKFRAWDNKGKYWYPAETMKDFFNYLSEKFAIVADWFNKDAITLEQYTGLKDKNGREIYEGDIVEGTMGIFEVKWYDSTSRFNFVPNIDMDWHPPFVCDQVNEMEVIGNIHENPELLK